MEGVGVAGEGDHSFLARPLHERETVMPTPYTVAYRPDLDPDEPWQVLSPRGEPYVSYATQGDAIEIAEEETSAALDAREYEAGIEREEREAVEEWEREQGGGGREQGRQAGGPDDPIGRPRGDHDAAVPGSSGMTGNQTVAQ